MTYGLIGEKLGHSYSKNIHERLGKYEYNLIELTKEDFPLFMERRGFEGLNVTIPYKKAVIPYCDELTSPAAEIGSVNTLYFRDGKLIGDNTDYYGFCQLVKRSGIPIAGKKVLILGAGGASLTVQKACKDLQAKQVLVAARSDGHAGLLLSDVTKQTDTQIIINATPVGMYPLNDDAVISLRDFPQCEGVIDLIYNPLLPRLLYEAKHLGIPYANGLFMLVAQAAKAFEVFTETILNDSVIEGITHSLESEIRNIVLIGMPGCGKTTAGKLLAQALNRPFIDTDLVVEKNMRLTIPEIFDVFGESAFRRMETKVAQETGKGHGQVIATGGGIVLNPVNMAYLSQNGIVIFLDRPLEKLALEGRPLSKSFPALEELAFQRVPLYEAACDLMMNMRDDPNENVGTLLKVIGGK